MKAREASQLSIGQRIELNDLRAATVLSQDLIKKQAWVRFDDGTKGSIDWAQFIEIELVENT